MPTTMHNSTASLILMAALCGCVVLWCAVLLILTRPRPRQRAFTEYALPRLRDARKHLRWLELAFDSEVISTLNILRIDEQDLRYDALRFYRPVWAKSPRLMRWLPLYRRHRAAERYYQRELTTMIRRYETELARRTTRRGATRPRESTRLAERLQQAQAPQMARPLTDSAGIIQ